LTIESKKWRDLKIQNSKRNSMVSLEVGENMQLHSILAHAFYGSFKHVFLALLTFLRPKI